MNYIISKKKIKMGDVEKHSSSFRSIADIVSLVNFCQDEQLIGWMGPDGRFTADKRFKSTDELLRELQRLETDGKTLYSRTPEGREHEVSYEDFLKVI